MGLAKGWERETIPVLVPSLQKREDAMANLFCVDGLQKVSPWEKMAPL